MGLAHNKHQFDIVYLKQDQPDSKIHGANIGPTGVLSAPDGPHVGPMNLAIRACMNNHTIVLFIPALTPPAV